MQPPPDVDIRTDPDKYRFGEVLSDFLRLYADAPSSPLQAEDGLVARLLRAAGGDEGALADALERRFGARGFFAAPERCLSSRFFAPLAALYDGALAPPCPAARPLDNTHKARALLPAPRAGGAPPAPAASPAPGARESEYARVRQNFGLLHSAETEQRDRERRSGLLPPSLLEWLAEDALAAADADAAAPGACAGAPAAAWRSLHELLRARARVRVVLASSGGGGGGGAVTGVLRCVDRCSNLLLLAAQWEEPESGDVGEGSVDGRRTGGVGAAELRDEATRETSGSCALPSKRKRLRSEEAIAAAVLVFGEHVVSVAPA